MSLTEIISELWNYAHTKEYREGLFVEASGLVLDVLLLIVGVKLVAYYIARQARNTTTLASSFFIAQFLRDILLLQLKSGGVQEVNAALTEAQKNGELKELLSHLLYGNTENVMELLRLRMRSGKHIAGHEGLTVEQRKSISKEARDLLNRLDGLLSILSSMHQDDDCFRAYDFRVRLTAVSNYFEHLSQSGMPPPPRTYAPMSTAMATSVEAWFSDCKAVLDRQYKSQIRRSRVRLVVSLPWVLTFRFVVRRWRRYRGQPYTDPFASNFPQLFCESLRSALGDHWLTVVSASAVDKKDIELLIAQHKPVSQDLCVALLEKLRSHVPPPLWNTVLTSSLTSDVDSRLISVVTVDAARANAIYYLTRLSASDDSSSHLIQHTLHSLWNLRPTSR